MLVQEGFRVVFERLEVGKAFRAVGVDAIGSEVR